MADRFRQHQHNAPTPCMCHPSNKLNRKIARHALKEEDRRERIVEWSPFSVSLVLDGGEPVQRDGAHEKYTCPCGTEVMRLVEDTPKLCLECEEEAR